jgi:NAD(P)-dependent dehydrogenase (short-subunit alcohol dehydrogenase family)
MEERIAIITGGLRGLGRAMAFGLAGAGHNVVAVGHIEADIAAIEAEMAGVKPAGRILPLVADLRRPADCDRVVAMTLSRFGSVHILVNNAGLTFTTIDPARFRRSEPQKFWQVPDDIVRAVIETNYIAADQMSRRVAPLMVEQGWGRIVNVTTKLDTMNRPHTSPYGASKAALEMATEVWAKEVEGTGLTINIVNPGRRRQHARHGRGDAHNEPRRPRLAPRRARGNGPAAAIRRLARSGPRQRLALRRQSLGPLIGPRRSRAPRRPPRWLRNAPAAGLKESGDEVCTHHRRSAADGGGCPASGALHPGWRRRIGPWRRS